ncbi:hypothetical protein [Haloferula sp.]|uniref:hypothetical protein n=1 Tax=Haloferula sp. TaxID=2497595 RepID=UPI003C751E73
MKEKPEEEVEQLVEEEAEKSKGWNWGMIVVGVFVVFVLAGLSAPMVLRCKKAPERTQAISNAKQVGLALLEFDQEFGSFPDEETAAMVKKSSETKLDLSGTSSNAMFRQLIAFGIQSEDIFYCLHPEGIRKPDRKMGPGKALEAGEVGFSYLMNGNEGQNTSDNPGRAVLAAPMKIGTEEFWSKPYQGKAVILRLDNSVDAPLIRKADGKVSVGNGKTLFDTGPETVWGNDGLVDVRHPERGR